MKSALKAAGLAYQCLSQNPKGRPNMSFVVEQLESLQSTMDLTYTSFTYTVGSGVTIYDIHNQPKVNGSTTNSSETCNKKLSSHKKVLETSLNGDSDFYSQSP